MVNLNDILGYKNRKIYQNDDYFSFSLDSVILANFCSIRKRDKFILDLCSGNGIVPFIVSLRSSCHIDGVEIQKELFDLAVSSCELNNLSEQISFFNCDIKDFLNKENSEKYDLITCNPPFFKYTDDSFINLGYEKTVARHEVLINLEEVVKISSSLLKSGGNLAMVHRTDRLLDVLFAFKKYNIEPKRIMFIYNKLSKGSTLFFIEGQKNGNVGLKIEKPFVVYNEDNSYTEEYSTITEEVLK